MRSFFPALAAGAYIALSIAAMTSPAKAKQPNTLTSKPSYYPHWVARDGTVTADLLRRLKPGSIIAAHHAWPMHDLQRILDAPGNFVVSWYIESNVQEKNDPAPRGMPVATRIGDAKRKQAQLAAVYGVDRFANLIELDGTRDKYEGTLRGEGNARGDWVADASAAKAAGFKYVAKSPTHAQVLALRSKFGADFVPRIVFEDVTANDKSRNPGYHADAETLAAKGETLTLIVHERAYGGFEATPLKKARQVIEKRFNNPNVEAYWGRKEAKDAFVKLKDFAAEPTAEWPHKENEAVGSEDGITAPAD